jgi:putative DNA primase/helicase
VKRWEEFKARIAQGRHNKPKRHPNKKSSGLGDRGTTVTRICPEAPPAENIIDAVIAFVHRFVFLKDEALYLLVAVWIVATYFHQDFDFSGYLFAYSPEPQSGKTTLLDVLNLLVANSSGIQISPTPAILFRTANGKTQLLDEIDTWMNHEELRSVLNAGFQKGAKVSRMDKDPKSGFKTQEFPVYGPKALAGIGFNQLTRATRDRTFALAMVRQKKGEKRERFRLRLVQLRIPGHVNTDSGAM